MKWVGIFAHRQNKALATTGAQVRVVQPVLWHPPAPLHHAHADWKKWKELNYPKERTYDGLTVYHPRIANMKPGKLFRRSYTDRYVDAIVNFFRKNHIPLHPGKDIFYAQWIPDAAMVQLAAHKLGIKSAVLLIGDDVLVWPHSSAHNMDIFKKTWREADLRLGVAGYLAKEGNALCGEDLSFSVIRRGVNHDFFKPIADKNGLRKKFGISTDKTVILSIGSLIVRKGWLDMLDALEQIVKQRPDIQLVAAHGGAPEFDFAAEASKRGLSSYILDLGEVDPAAINELYNTADIFCLASHWEGIANSVVEAMASGIAVITTDVCGHPELVRSGENGILISPKQPAMLQAALLDLLNNPEKRNALGATARQFITQQWGDFAYNANKLYQLLSAAVTA